MKISKIGCLEQKIKTLINKYCLLQKQYNGDTSQSKEIEGQIEGLECTIDTLKQKGVKHD